MKSRPPRPGFLSGRVPIFHGPPCSRCAGGPPPTATGDEPPQQGGIPPLPAARPALMSDEGRQLELRALAVGLRFKVFHIVSNGTVLDYEPLVKPV